jgi:hypothetical protein
MPMPKVKLCSPTGSFTLYGDPVVVNLLRRSADRRKLSRVCIGGFLPKAATPADFSNLPSRMERRKFSKISKVQEIENAVGQPVRC